MNDFDSLKEGLPLFGFLDPESLTGSEVHVYNIKKQDYNKILKELKNLKETEFGNTEQSVYELPEEEKLEKED